MNPSAPVKTSEKKKGKKTHLDEPMGQEGHTTQGNPVEISDVEKQKERKKKKSKTTHSSSTTTIPDDSTSGKQPDPPQGANHETTKGPSQEKISGPNNEISNSCLQPPSIKVIFELSFELGNISVKFAPSNFVFLYSF
jgi:hypothetical protein